MAVFKVETVPSAVEIKCLLFVCVCRLQDEISQREEAEGNMQSFRQVQYDSCNEIKPFPTVDVR